MIKQILSMFPILLFFIMCIYQFVEGKDLTWFIADLILLVMYSIAFGINLTSVMKGSK